MPRSAQDVRTVDARSVPPAAGAWLAAWVAVARPVDAVALGAAAALGLAAAAGAVIIATRRGRPAGARHRASALTAPAAATLLAAGVVAAVLLSTAAQLHHRQGGHLADLTSRGASVVVTARVATEPEALGRAREWEAAPRVRVHLDLESVAGRGERSRTAVPVVLLGPPAWGEVTLGERVRVRATLAATEPGERAAALLLTGDPPEVLGPPPASLRVVNAMRGELRSATAGLSPQARGLVPGIAVGDDRALPTELAEDMRATGLTHLTAVSGAHVAILLGAVLGATAWLPRRGRAVVGALALVAFVLLVRPEASVLRSAAMGAVVLVALLLGRPSRALPALAAAVVGLVLLDPWLAREYGFALSVLATGGVVLLARPWAAWLSHVVPRWLAVGIAVPAAAQAACGPVVVLLTPALAVYAVPANLLAAAAVPPATVLGVAATLLGPVWPAAASVLVTGAAAFTWWIATVAQTFADLPAAQVPWPDGVPGVLTLAVATAAVVGVLARAGPRATWLRPAVVAAVVLPALLVLPWRDHLVAALPDGWPPRGWVAIQCDVGQGAAFLLRSDADAAVMVDTGPDGGGAGDCLGDADVGRVDLLVLTHAHADHVGGLAEVLAAAEVTAAVLGPGPEPAPGVRETLTQLADAAVPVSRPVAGEVPAPADEAPGSPAGGPPDRGRAGEVDWQVLWPTPGAVARSPGADGVNDLSLVLRLAAPGADVVALGDVELAGQAGVRGRLTEAPADPADVVVMAHHGSARQDAGLAAVLRPRLTVVSVGADNDYGHPAASALELYARTGSVVLRTDTCGQIALVRRGSDLATVSRCR
ncbi:competence protein ComEC [Georgenia muralis]|uniref:Competence protein ComEC n=1 Tax=Georgenia muralis TaxID=154117 RepID=A0A3N4Z958_9MICO|nr:competence protein ComEC [Georgenia muralis]